MPEMETVTKIAASTMDFTMHRGIGTPQKSANGSIALVVLQNEMSATSDYLLDSLLMEDTEITENWFKIWLTAKKIVTTIAAGMLLIRPPTEGMEETE